ncbi:glycosyltransferase family 4 protein [Fodinicola feengrottensis]|nr:glycosyltransferase family 4 protein [Fodinicola feengrottensis]
MAIETVAALCERGIEVVVTVPADGPLSDRVRELGARVVVLPVPVLRRGYLSAGGILRILRESAVALPACVRLVRKVKPSVVYVNTVTIPIWVLAGRVAGRPVIGHVHELEAGVGRLVRLGLTGPLWAARKVIANSAATKDFLSAGSRRLARRTVLIYNGVPGPPRPLKDLPASPSTPLGLLYVGRLSERKGTDVAIDALSLLVERGIPATLELVGSVFPGNEAFEAALRDRVRDRGLSDAVTFAGFTDDVWGAYERADIVVVPSRLEPFGLVAVEAQLAVRPVVSSDAQGLVEAVAAGETGLVVPAGDPAALADAVTGLVKDWPRAREMAQQGQERAVRLFSPDGYRAAIAELLTEGPQR